MKKDQAYFIRVVGICERVQLQSSSTQMRVRVHLYGFVTIMVGWYR